MSILVTKATVRPAKDYRFFANRRTQHQCGKRTIVPFFSLLLSLSCVLLPARAVAGAESKNESPGSESKNASIFADNPKKLRPLPCMTWVDYDREHKAVLLCVHGLGLHNDAYAAFGKRLSSLGYVVYAVDVPGFGSFQNKEGEGEKIDFTYCLDGIKRTLEFIHKVYRKLPVYVVGESMGGAIALRVTAEHPELVDGLISSVPSGDRFQQNKEALRIGLKLLTAPNKPFNIGSSVIERATENLPEDKKDQLRKDWKEGELNRMELSPKELVRFQNFMNDNFEYAKKITSTPVLFVQGKEDRLVHPEGTEALFNALGSKDREYRLIEDKAHLIFEENQFDDHVIDLVNNWLTVHIKAVGLTQK